MEQVSGDGNVTEIVQELDDQDRIPRNVSPQQVNWITTLTPLFVLITILLLVVLVHRIRNKKQTGKRGEPDPDVCMHPDPTAGCDVRRSFLREYRTAA